MVREMSDEVLDRRIYNKGVRKNVPKKKKKVVRKKYKKIPLTLSVSLRVLHQEVEVCGKELVRRNPTYSSSNIYKHMKKPVDVDPVDKRKNNPGRPQLLTPRHGRRILRQITKLRPETNGDFTVGDIRNGADVDEQISRQTVSRVLWHEGYALRHKLRKGVLTCADLIKRLKYAREMKKTTTADFWTKEVSFYLDGSGFTHKYNPCENARRSNAMTWRKPKEGRAPHCTGPGKKEGTGGRVGKFMVAISYGKGVTLCEEMTEKLTGKSFAKFVMEQFPNAFKKSTNPEGKVFLQDGDPSQNSAAAMMAVCEIGATRLSIPARSPDLNPIENFFHIVKKQLKRQAIERNLTWESYSDFVKRVKKTMEESSVHVINKIISTMNKRIDLIIKHKGERLRY